MVRSSLNNAEGTVVKEDAEVERMLVSGVAVDKNAARIAIIGLKDEPGIAFNVFDLLAKHNINVDVIRSPSDVTEARISPLPFPETTRRRRLRC